MLAPKHPYWSIALGVILGAAGSVMRVNATYAPRSAQLAITSLGVAASPASLPITYTPTLGPWVNVTAPANSEIVTWESGALERGCHTAAALDQPYSETPCHFLQETTAWLRLPSDHQLSFNRQVPGSTLRPAAVTTRPLQRGEVIFSEVMWMGSYRGEESFSTDEWLELYNTTDQVLQLQGCELRNLSSSGGSVFIDQPLVISPYGVVVIGRKAGTETQLARTPDLVAHFTLSNAGAQGELWCGQHQIDALPLGEWKAGQNDTDNHRRSSAQRRWPRQREDHPSEWSDWGECTQENSAACLRLSQQSWQQPNTQNWATPWLPPVL